MPIRLSPHAKLIRFPSADGLSLEGRLTPGAPDRGVVLCHPHPLYQGSMLTPVIMTTEQVFQESGWTTLAFNFRGVGGSEGSYGDGRTETADVTGALDFVQGHLGGSPRLLAIAGFSFGSVVGGQVAASDPRVRFYLGIAPPTQRSDFSFLKGATCAIALIAPTRDEFADEERLQTLYLSLPATPWLRRIETEHLFPGALPELAAAVKEAIAWAEAPPKRP